jgi:hypothetical protein
MRREGLETHIMKKKHRREGSLHVASLFLFPKVVTDEAPLLSPHSSQALETQSSKS